MCVPLEVGALQPIPGRVWGDGRCVKGYAVIFGLEMQIVLARRSFD